MDARKPRRENLDGEGLEKGEPSVKFSRFLNAEQSKRDTRDAIFSAISPIPGCDDDHVDDLVGKAIP